MHKHAVLWVDHGHAQLVVLHADDAGHDVVEIPGPKGHQGHNKRHDDGHRHALDHGYAETLCKTIANVEGLLLVGPGSAKDELVQFVKQKHAALGKHIVGVEPIDHPTAGQLKEHGRTFFKSADRMMGEHVG